MLALDTAERMLAVRWVPITLFMSSALSTFSALLTSSTVLRWLFVTNVVLFAGSGLLHLMMFRRARRLLAAEDDNRRRGAGGEEGTPRS